MASGPIASLVVHCMQHIEFCAVADRNITEMRLACARSLGYYWVSGRAAGKTWRQYYIHCRSGLSTQIIFAIFLH